MLSNKFAVITGSGSGSGIGAATAKIFVRENVAGIAIVDYNYEAACKTAEEMGPTVFPVKCDVSNPKQVDAATHRSWKNSAASTFLSTTPPGAIPVSVFWSTAANNLHIPKTSRNASAFRDVYIGQISFSALRISPASCRIRWGLSGLWDNISGVVSPLITKIPVTPAFRPDLISV